METCMLLLGGGFGGKETRTCILSTAIVIAANKCVILKSIFDFLCCRNSNYCVGLRCQFV